MKSSLLLLPGLAATCLGAVVPVDARNALVRRVDQAVTVIVTITSTTTKSSSTTSRATVAPKPSSTVVVVTVTATVTRATTTAAPVVTAAPHTTASATGWTPPWITGFSGFRPPWLSWLTLLTQQPVTVTDSAGPVTVYLPSYITVTATDPDDSHQATVTLPALSSRGKRDEDRHSGPNHWGHHHTSQWHSTQQYNPPDPETSTVYVHPQDTASTSTVYVTSPSIVSTVSTVYVTASNTFSTVYVTASSTASTVYVSPSNTVSTVYVTATSIVSTVYASPPSTVSTIYASPPPSSTDTLETIVVTRKTSSIPPGVTFYPPRNAAPDPAAQIFGLGPISRTVQEAPTPPLPWWNWRPSATPIEIIERDTEEKREPQTLDFGTRTVQEEPEYTTLDRAVNDPPHYLGHKHTFTTPYEIDTTATLSMLTIYKKRKPQTLGSPTRTNEITPTGPSSWYPYSSSVSTIYVTVTQFPYGPTSHPHHHPNSISTIIYSSTDDFFAPDPTQTGTLIEATLTLPFVVTPTANYKEKRIAEAEPEPEPQTLTLNFPSTVTITYTDTVIENTATLPPLTISDSGWWGRKDKRSRQHAEFQDPGQKEEPEEIEKVKRQHYIKTQTRSFTFKPPAMASASMSS
ncbi:hypothetical protein EG329_011021 [Mollisiaceae sp. DMI_Dod_QoI]|nr:hypothetical protein EG329_011021 [Helotiales sp. DMI_Dod_QoI]